MHHSRALPTRACGQDKLLETWEDLVPALEPQPLQCLSLNKTTFFLRPPDFHPVKIRFDLVVRLVSARRSNLSPVVVMSSHH